MTTIEALPAEAGRALQQARLQARFGLSWRRKAPVQTLMPLHIA
jgi:hypothetical protein